MKFPLGNRSQGPYARNGCFGIMNSPAIRLTIALAMAASRASAAQVESVPIASPTTP